MATVRHWKQKFDKDAEFVYTRRMRVGEQPQPFKQRGDDVDNERIGLKKLRQFWDLGWIELKRFSLPTSLQQRRAAAQDAAPKLTTVEPKDTKVHTQKAKAEAGTKPRPKRKPKKKSK